MIKIDVIIIIIIIMILVNFFFSNGNSKSNHYKVPQFSPLALSPNGFYVPVFSLFLKRIVQLYNCMLIIIKMLHRAKCFVSYPCI